MKIVKNHISDISHVTILRCNVHRRISMQDHSLCKETFGVLLRTDTRVIRKYFPKSFISDSFFFLLCTSLKC